VNAAHPADTDWGAASLREPAVTAAKAAARMAKFVRMARPVPPFFAKTLIGAPTVANAPDRRDGTRMLAMDAAAEPNLFFIAAPQSGNNSSISTQRRPFATTGFTHRRPSSVRRASEGTGSMSIDAIAVAVAFIAMAASVVVLTGASPSFTLAGNRCIFWHPPRGMPKVWRFNGDGQQFLRSREQLSHAGEK
jgi:hypothetical protein